MTNRASQKTVRTALSLTLMTALFALAACTQSGGSSGLNTNRGSSSVHFQYDSGPYWGYLGYHSVPVGVSAPSSRSAPAYSGGNYNADIPSASLGGSIGGGAYDFGRNASF